MAAKMAVEYGLELFNPLLVPYRLHKSTVLTIWVHSGMQYPLSFQIGNPGGNAILSVYSRPISIIPASYFLNFFVR